MLHRPGIEPGPPAWQASILPLNQRCFNEKDDESFEYLDFNIPKGQLISKCPFCCLQSCQQQQLETKTIVINKKLPVKGETVCDVHCWKKVKVFVCVPIDFIQFC